jgi:mRNA interferase HigB
MRIITRKRVASFGRAHADARNALGVWLQRTAQASWRSLVDTRKVFPHADEVRVASGRTARVFNIRGNNYRLITAIHYNTGVVFLMRFLTHGEYNAGNWKDTL